MGIRSKVAMLPAAVRAELDRRIVERAFSGYQALAECLQAQGYHIADDSVQRYGVRLRRQLETLDLASHYARALAAAASGAGDTGDALTAVTVQLLQQQVLSVLLQHAQLEAFDRPETTGTVSPGDSEEPEKLTGELSAPLPAGGEAENLDVRDLLRLTPVTADLNRLIKAPHRRGEQLSSHAETAADEPPRPGSDTLSEEVCQQIRNAVLAINPFALSSSAASPPEHSGTPAKPLKPASVAVPAEARQSALESTQPQLTAASRTCPHPKHSRESIADWVPHTQLRALTECRTGCSPGD